MACGGAPEWAAEEIRRRGTMWAAKAKAKVQAKSKIVPEARTSTNHAKARADAVAFSGPILLVAGATDGRTETGTDGDGTEDCVIAYVPV